MLCPDCGHDNIAGADECEACGQALIHFDPLGSELEESIARHSVDGLAPRKPLAIDAGVTARQAIAELTAKQIGCLLVMQGDQLAGIFSERDVLNKIATDPDKLLDRPVKEFMTPHPETIRRRDSIAYAMQRMKLGGYRHLPVLDDRGKATGIISIRDILRFLCVRFAELRPHVK